ncbi:MULTISPECIES: hypothetical protein [Brevibacterium]|uniref:Uncharacterized protein n=2 Tax=Brevibacterium TaxID=1696 RepID=A0A2H1J7A6_BRELN|nr:MULTISPECIES: hypothetical protein [Brevibacterium]TGD37841.1 hypothetical protein EB834_13255 [Brevibacterium aurantiacum]SMX83356.1 hypothetical protein BLIN101_02011 [Brevibacterium linens]
MIPSILLLGIVLIFAFKFKDFDRPRSWQLSRTIIYGLSGLFVLFVDADEASLVSFTLYVGFAALDNFSGYMAKISGADNDTTWIEMLMLSARAPKVILQRTIEYFFRRISRLDWSIQVNSKSWIVRSMKSVLNIDDKNIVAISLFFYFAALCLAVIIGLLVGSVQVASLISSDSTESASFRKFSVLFLMVYGPRVLLFWVGAGAVIGVLNSVFTYRGSLLRTAKVILVQFAGATGVGAALGLVLGIVSPGVWLQMQEMGIVAESASFGPPVDGELAVSMSSLGLVLGAFLGTYISLRQAAKDINNRVYREVSVFLSIVVSVKIFEYYRIATPSAMVDMIADTSGVDLSSLEDRDLSNREMDELLISLPPEDFAKLLVETHQEGILYQMDLVQIILWVAGIIGLMFMVVALFVESRASSRQDNLKI